ncbi:Uncharacterised protein [Mycobacteroides abscessus subsp. abscessus]|nr:Uncharacterised protein [Mycobacteroides abscessus subsp. abscessus]
MIKTYIFRNAYDLAYSFDFCLIFIIEQNYMYKWHFIMNKLNPIYLKDYYKIGGYE